MFLKKNESRGGKIVTHEKPTTTTAAHWVNVNDGCLSEALRKSIKQEISANMVDLNESCN